MTIFDKNIGDFKEAPKTLADFFYLIRQILTEWVDLKESDYNIVALWILGTWLHEKFASFPFLFLNAMKRSGKTRLLNLISQLSRKGYLVVNLTEAVLFRLPAAEKITMCIDEAENISGREKQALRQLLNAGYKKGLLVPRARKVPQTEKWVVDKFEVYTPIAIANISGMDDVLEDRCITIVIERSDRTDIINKIEWFDRDPLIQQFIAGIPVLVDLVYKCSVDAPIHSIGNAVSDTLTTQTTQTTPPLSLSTTLTTLTTSYLHYNKDSSQIDHKLDINEIYTITTLNGVSGRDFEIWYPLLWLAWMISDEKNNLVYTLLPAIYDIVHQKGETDLIENRDTIFLAFLYNNYEDSSDFIGVKDIVAKYKEQNLGEDWFSPRWIGRAMRRMNLTSDKRRLSKGFEVRLNYVTLKRLCQKFNIMKEFPSKEPEESQKTVEQALEESDKNYKEFKEHMEGA